MDRLPARRGIAKRMINANTQTCREFCNMKIPLGSFTIGIKNLFNFFAKQFAEFKRQRKTGGIFSVFQRDDGLPRHAGAVGQFGLRPIVFGAKTFSRFFIDNAAARKSWRRSTRP